MRLLLSFALLFIFQNAYANEYQAHEWQHKSYDITKTDFYTLQQCDKIIIEHVVSKKDAFHSGGQNWSIERKQAFANDKENHVLSCADINASKSASMPQDFFRKSNDGKGKEYDIVRKCAYLTIYKKVKMKYDLSFRNNDIDFLNSCEGYIF